MALFPQELGNFLHPLARQGIDDASLCLPVFKEAQQLRLGAVFLQYRVADLNGQTVMNRLAERSQNRTMSSRVAGRRWRSGDEETWKRSTTRAAYSGQVVPVRLCGPRL
jgi:hypothetical protein